jgi:2-polyprenyl-6-hydroxyphenyl methylase/3-demethylubiquinone-9 3-methyltransferase
VAPAARSLHDHDLVEFHCPDPRNFYSQMYKRRLAVMLEALRRHVPNGRLLDLGCAQGNVALLAAEAGLESYAVDLRPEFLHYAGLKHERGRFQRVASDATHLPFPNGFFHAVVWGEVIEHVAYPEKILAEIARVLQPGGMLLVTTPNGARLRTGLPTFSQVADRSPLEARQFQPDSDGHLFLFTRKELSAVLSQSGFRVLAQSLYATPWVSGRLAFRHWMSWMPPRLRNRMEEWTLRASPVAGLLSEGQVAIAQRR